MKLKTQLGIVSYAAQIPHQRIQVAEIAKAWNKDADGISKGLGVYEKAVAQSDQDTITLAVDACHMALQKLDFFPKIGAIYTGSESHPYAVKPSSVVIGEALGIEHDYTAADLEFACKAGTAAMQIVAGMLAGQMIDYGLAIGADTAQSKPGDILEYTAAAAGAAFIMGAKTSNMITNLLYTSTFTSDTPDFWRREHQFYPSHAGRFTGEPAYFKHIQAAIKLILDESKMQIKDFNHVVLHMPNGQFPQKAAKTLGVTDSQLQAGFVVPNIGNSYSACSMVGLAAVLDKAKPGDLILHCSYGSGSGSDAFIWQVTDKIKRLLKLDSVEQQIAHKRYISYPQYLRNLNKLKY